jgi:dimethylglycine dehydrogenase
MPGETGLDRFIRWNKPSDWIGKAAAMKEKAEGPKRKLCAFVVDAADADVVAWEPIWLDGAVVGFCTSGGFSHFTGKSVAQGFVPSDRVKDGLKVEIEILGERRPAVLVTEPLFDGDGARMRG